MADPTHDLFSAVFGKTDSSGSDDGDDDGGLSDDDWSLEFHDFCEWHSIEAVPGLWHGTSFLKPQEEQSLVNAIEDEGWFTEPLHNQAMRFGELPGWALTLSSRISSSICAFNREQPEGIVCQKSSRDAPLADDILYKEPLFDQMIVNSYQPGEGIAPHVDLARFRDGIAVVSLLSSCVMTFRRCEDATLKRDVLLSPGDVILLSGDARYSWTHEINRKNEQVWLGNVLKQERRISVTLRRLCY